MSNEIDLFLEHYGVMGMHWGVRKDGISKQAMQDAKSDRKKTRQLMTGPTYKGIRADRKAHGEKIKARIASDPEYAKAIKKIDRNQDRAFGIALSVFTGIYLAGAMAPLVYDIAHDPRTVYKVNKGMHFVSRKIMNKFPGGVFRPNPKKSQYWTKDTVKGSATVIGNAVELYRKYG